MSFRLTNAPRLFMDLMNKVFKPYLDMFSIVFIDDNLIYILRSEEDHASNLRITFQTLKGEELYVKFSKCELFLESMTFLGHIYSIDRILVFIK